MYVYLHAKHPFFFSDLNQTWVFSTDFRKIIQRQFSLTILPVGAECGQTDVTKPILALWTPLNHGQENEHPFLDLNRIPRANKERLIRTGCLGYLLRTIFMIRNTSIELAVANELSVQTTNSMALCCRIPSYSSLLHHKQIYGLKW
jgi:hypothetical protein